ncbi:ubiquinone anaerobic biosynthesis accessory factor UbiT [Shewanella inventionis]|uniref:Ubiquinone biosynthesis accessory factor UbiT n=1 Tax=Shewanella inventionis TaxID=1738770 RepID=A0ABQ1J2D1_9GAMM|nr:SCP2 sterol-binding domain-containing protein [Shewanella inventionis]MCL1157317.1 SCP2 sterol-binding domain-containing protein [Shewanella inventionis]GGB55717.1 SCP-2 sterol transfer family protein [Shewanella inventionis]
MAQILQQRLSGFILDIAPQFSRRSLALVPNKLKMSLITQMLNLVLSEQLRAGELVFLKDKSVGICVDDIDLQFQVAFDSKLQALPMTNPNVIFSANVPELLLVAAAKEDPDTLFFQRKLRIEGDTELGLEVKNMLLSIELDTLPRPIKLTVDKLACMLQALTLGPETAK